MYGDITSGINQIFNFAQFILVIWSLIHVSRTRPDAFEAAGKQTKIFWTLILGGALVLGTAIGIFRLLGLIAALIYLLDVRPAVDEVQKPRW